MRRGAVNSLGALGSLLWLALQLSACSDEDPLDGMRVEGELGRPIALELRGGLLTASVSVDGGEPGRFIVDSGAQYVLLHRPYAEELGYGELVSRVDEISLGELSFRNVEAASWDLAPFARVIDDELDGVLGESILRHFTAVVDYQRLELTLLSGDERAAGLVDPGRVEEGALSATVSSRVGLPIGMASFEGAPSAQVLLDTGASTTLLLSRAYEQLDNEGRTVLEGARGVGVAGTFSVDRVRLCGASLGEAWVRDLTAGVMPDEALGEAASVFPDLAAVLGYTFFREFLTVLDLPSSRARFYRFLDRAHIPDDEFDRVGVELQRLDDGRVVIASVFAGTDAEEQGLEAGDQVLSIDGASMEGLDGEALDQALRGTPGQRLTLELAGGTPRTVEVEVEALLPRCES